MAMKIVVEECIVCGACEPECPNESISHADTYVVDALKCTECVGAYEDPRCVEVCPIEGCIVPDPDHRESRDELQRRYDSLHPEG
jgi:ferredoxin